MPRLKENATPPSGASLQDLERHKAAIMREIEKSRGEDKKEVDKLRADLDEANEWIKARKKADDSREDQDGGTTIVVPPNTMAPQAGGETRPTTEGNGPSDQPTKGKGWKGLW
jgi:hypothetical protein